MKCANPFDVKTVEKALFTAHKHGELQGRKTRKFLRQMARDICRAWEIGYREAAAGKALIPYEELPANGVSPLRRDIFNRTYVAYKSGYRSGAQDLKEG